MITLLTDDLRFPPATTANEEGIVAIGGDLRAERLLLAYRLGIFPWPVEGYPLLWFCPDPRCCLVPSELHISRSLKRSIAKDRFVITFDQAFDQVISACAETPRPGQSGTWITDEITAAYSRLHRLGYAHSVEAWADDELVGGAYGISLGNAFAGESMFALQDDASKVAFVALVRELTRRGCTLIDCQVYTEHLSKFGAKLLDRTTFLTAWSEAVSHPTVAKRW